MNELRQRSVSRVAAQHLHRHDTPSRHHSAAERGCRFRPIAAVAHLSAGWASWTRGGITTRRSVVTCSTSEAALCMRERLEALIRLRATHPATG
jgi:hypothetical protein